MKKFALIVTAFLGMGIATIVHATSTSNYTVFQNVSCNNGGYNCDLNLGSGQEIDSCTFTFTSCNTRYGSLSCDLDGQFASCQLGSRNGSCQTWTCTLDQQQLGCLNQNGGICNFDLNCKGSWNIGSCDVTYGCQPKDHTVPDSATTIYLLGAVLAGAEITRRLMSASKLAMTKK